MYVLARNINWYSPAPISQLSRLFHFLSLFRNLFIVLATLVSLNSIFVNVIPLALILCLLSFRSQNYLLGLPRFELLLYLALERVIKPYTFQYPSM
jgi:hypothetical protein